VKHFSVTFRALIAVAVLACLQPATAHACAACYGQSDSPLAQGFNLGIISLLGVVLTVLSGIASFFIYLARRSASQGPPQPVAEPQTPVTAH
jgi:hypothetical protein